MNWQQYGKNWNLYLRGFRWLWTHEVVEGSNGKVYPVRSTRDFQSTEYILYKPGWTPWKFLPLYLTTYLAGTLLGYGVVSLSRAWYERRNTSKFAKFMTRLLDWAFPGKHGVDTGGWLWGSIPARRVP